MNDNGYDYEFLTSEIEKKNNRQKGKGIFPNWYDAIYSNQRRIYTLGTYVGTKVQ